MSRDLTRLFAIGDSVCVVLKKPLTPLCTGSETSLRDGSDENIALITSVTGKYVGERPGLIKINPEDKNLLNDPANLISRYLTISIEHIKEVYKKIFP